MAPKDVDLAYAAGIVDGEGSISAPASHRCPKNFRISLTVGMCDRAVPDFMSSIFGGKVREEKHRTRSGKPVYSWNLYCRNAANALILLMPYLRVKKDRARDAVELASMMKARRVAKHAEFSASEIERRYQLAKSVKDANFSSNGRLARHAIAQG